MNDWISIEDQLPLIGQFIRVNSMWHGKFTRVTITARFDFEDDAEEISPGILPTCWYGINWLTSDKISGVTHWMPMEDNRE